MNGKQNGKRAGEPSRLAARLLAKLGRPIIRRLNDLARESLKQPGSWRCLEIVYKNEPRTLLDRFFLSSRSARGARNRLRVLNQEICKCIEQRSQNTNPVRIISFGSGPGHEILGCLERFKGNMSVQATCVDRELSTLEYGKLLAAQKGLSSYIKYVQGNVLRMNSMIAEYDIGILSGLIDYFDFECFPSAEVAQDNAFGYERPSSVFLHAGKHLKSQISAP